MIKANEIMVGSILNYQTSEGDIAPTIIDWQDLKWLTEDPIGFNLVHSGMPITEEILVKAGFIRGSVTMYFLPIPELNCEIHATWFHNQYVIELQNHRIPMVTKVEHLHQLQLLYFSLTGQHLNIKL